MLKTIDTAQHFIIAPSKQVTAVLDGLHLLAIMASFLNGLQTTYQLVMAVMVIVLWWFSFKRRKTSLVYLSYTLNRTWEISLDGYSYSGARMLDTTVIANRAIFLHFTMDDQSRTALMIAKDSMPASDYRRLTVRLKLSGYGQGR